MARQPTTSATRRVSKADKMIRENNEKAIRLTTGGPIICPKWLDKDASVEFDRLVRELAEINILSTVDTTALAVCCDAYSKWRQATAIVNGEGLLTIDGKSGERVSNPAIKEALRYGELYRKMTVECGLTPNARLRLAVKNVNISDKPQDELFKFITGGV